MGVVARRWICSIHIYYDYCFHYLFYTWHFKRQFPDQITGTFFVWNNNISIEECTKNGCPSRWWKQPQYTEYRRDIRNNYRRKLKKLGHAHQWNFPFNAHFCQRTTFSSLGMCLNKAFVVSGRAFISKAIHCNGEYFPFIFYREYWVVLFMEIYIEEPVT